MGTILGLAKTLFVDLLFKKSKDVVAYAANKAISSSDKLVSTLLERVADSRVWLVSVTFAAIFYTEGRLELALIAISTALIVEGARDVAGMLRKKK